MDFDLSETQELIASGAREFLAARVSGDLVRNIAAGTGSYSDSWWRDVTQLEWPGLLVPEELGGAGLGFPELGALLEEWGAVLAPGPLLETALQGASAINRFGNDGQLKEFLPPIAAGEMIVTPAVHEEQPAWAHISLNASARFINGRWTLNGEKRFAPFAANANLMLVSASTGPSADDCTLFLVRPEDSRGIELTPMKTAAGPPLSRVRLHDVQVTEDAVLGEVGRGQEAIDYLMLLGAVGRSLQMAGAARQVVNMTVDYVSNRHQFGRPVGSFQAVQHHCANMAVAAKGMALLSRKAAWTLSEGSNPARAAAMAKVKANRELPYVCALAHQCHGAIGFTWEHNLHLFTRHALHWRSDYGDTNYHRKKLMTEASA